MLPRKDREHLLKQCKTVELKFEEILWQLGKPIRHVYFPLDAFVSLVAAIEDDPVLEVGMIGREGMLGVPVALGVAAAPLHAVVQGAGTALRIDAAAFRRAVDSSVALRRLTHSYVSVLMNQTALSAACVKFHSIGPRLARWLLMTQDRARTDAFDVTHQFLSHMLGVRRVGVTVAAGALKAQGLVSYSRGAFAVLDRAGLESAACSCYRADRAYYDKAFEG